MSERDQEEIAGKRAGLGRRAIRVGLSAIVGFAVVFTALIFFQQRRMIYMPRAYDESYARATKGLIEIPYDVAGAPQIAFYAPPRTNPQGRPEPLWAIFGGNASLALDWLDLVEAYPDGQAGFLLIDYPGYGKCLGSATLKTIEAAGAAALEAADRRLNPDGRAPLRFAFLGHSVGAAAALQAAARRDEERIVMISPFTTMMDMARRTVGWPLCYLLIDRFDNRARLREIAARNPPTPLIRGASIDNRARLREIASRPNRPPVTILHGGADEIIPVSMGRELAGMYPDWITYREIPGGDHNYILSSEQKRIIDAMMGK